MSDKILTVYHTTAKKREKSILKNGFYKSKGQNQWLGEGVYFYKDIYYAVQWGFLGVVKGQIIDINEFKDKCSILSLELNCEECNVLDLNTPDGYEIFLWFKDHIKSIFSEEEAKEILSKGDAYLIYTLEQLEKDHAIELISKYDIVIAEYDKDVYKKNRDNKLISDFNGCKERQVCVKNLDIIKNINVLDLDDCEIENLFNLVKKNRGG